MSEVTRAIWLMSKTICSVHGFNMEENISVLFTTSEQHRTATLSSVNRDKSDTDMIHLRLKGSSPCKDDPSLHNTINGITAAESVNVAKFGEIGRQLITKMVGQDVFKYKLKRKERAKNITVSVTLCTKENIKCYPALLFQRLLLVSQTSSVDLDDIKSYEFALEAYPLSLFENPSFLRKSDKPQLAGSIVKYVKEYCNKERLVEAIEQPILLDDNETQIEIVVENLADRCFDSPSHSSTHQYVIERGGGGVSFR